MSKVRAKETKPEVLVRKYLFKLGYRYRKNVKTLPGSPDIVLPKYKTVIFIHGCFWHGHSCKDGMLPSSNLEYWKQKTESNIKRDKKRIAELKKSGWKVIVLWQCKLKSKTIRNKSFNALIKKIKKY